MLDVFKKLLSKEKPDYMISSSIVSYEGIYSIVSRWVKEGKYYCGQSYYTDTWIAKSLFDVLSRKNVQLTVLSELSDIANIEVYDNLSDCISKYNVSCHDIEDVVRFVQTEIDRQCKILFSSELDFHDKIVLKLVWSPCPMFVISIYDVWKPIGSLIVLTDGYVHIATYHDKRIEQYANTLCSKIFRFTVNGEDIVKPKEVLCALSSGEDVTEV